MSAGPKQKPLVSLEADGDRLDAARRQLLADWCRLVGTRLNGPTPAAAGAAAAQPSAPRSAANVAGPSDRPVASAAVSEAPASSDQPRPADPTPSATISGLGLPKRMSQILMALLAGASEKQIAATLSISPHTVHTYVKQLHKRLDVSSRGELLAKFVRLGD